MYEAQTLNVPPQTNKFQQKCSIPNTWKFRPCSLSEAPFQREFFVAVFVAPGFFRFSSSPLLPFFGQTMKGDLDRWAFPFPFFPFVPVAYSFLCLSLSNNLRPP